MEKIIWKFLLFLVNIFPKKETRHLLRKKLNRYFDLELIPKQAIQKKFAFQDGIYKTVSLGSSHGESMFNPEYIESRAFNFCLTSTDAFMMYEIYRNLIKNSNTENVIIFYDPFTKGSKNYKTKSFMHFFYPLKYILNINYQGENKRIEKKCKRAIENYKNEDLNYNGYTAYKYPAIEDPNHYKSHLKLWKMGGEDKWIMKIAKECIEDNKKFILAISPATKLYKSYLPDSKTIFHDILNELENIDNYSKFIKIYNFYDTDEFENDDLWIDPDHTNAKGAEVFTKVLNKKLKQDKII